MPELRRKSRRSRVSEDPIPIVHQTPVKLTVRTRHRGKPAKRGGEKCIKGGNDAIDADGEREIVNPGIGLETSEGEVGKDKELLEVGVKAMDEFDSGGRNGDKGPKAEDESTAAPLPEKVRLFSDVS